MKKISKCRKNLADVTSIGNINFVWHKPRNMGEKYYQMVQELWAKTKMAALQRHHGASRQDCNKLSSGGGTRFVALQFTVFANSSGLAKKKRKKILFCI